MTYRLAVPCLLAALGLASCGGEAAPPRVTPLSAAAAEPAATPAPVPGGAARRPRDPHAVIEALRIPFPLPDRSRLHLDPGVRGAGIRIVHLGGEGGELCIATHRVLDVTELVAATVPPGQAYHGGDRLGSILLDLAVFELHHVLSTGLPSDGTVLSRLEAVPQAFEIGVEGVEIIVAPPIGDGQLVRTLVTPTGTVTVVAVLRPDGFQGSPGGAMQAGSPTHEDSGLLVDLHVTACESGFAPPHQGP